jgi:phosphoribosylglycinamide formyltransferase-1
MFEIEVLSNFDEYLRNPQNTFKDIEKGEPHKRMPLNIEKEMVRRFSEYVERYGRIN